MTILNNIQYREYNRAQALTLLFSKSRSIYATFTPFAKEVTAFLRNVEKIPVEATIKEKNGKGATAEKKALKLAIAQEGAYLCTMTMAYALETGNNMLKYAIPYTYTDIFTIRDAEVPGLVLTITTNIEPLLNEKAFGEYKITEHHLASITQKGEAYRRNIGKASRLNSASRIASASITETLEKIKDNIAQFNRFLPFFSTTHPGFVADFREACIIHNTGAHVNAIEGTITEEGTGKPVADVCIVGEDKNKTAITNVSGFYRLTGIKTGTRLFSITAKGYETEVVEVKVIRGKTVELNINLRAISLKLSAEEAA